MTEKLLLAILLFCAPSVAMAQSVDRAHEGDWFISDQTDNNTGDREVYAMRINGKSKELVFLQIRCTQGKPIFWIEWYDLKTPDQVVITVATVDPAVDRKDQQFIFARSEDGVHNGLAASPEVSVALVAAFGSARHVTISVHLEAGRKDEGFDVAGTPRAWQRVVRNCPVRKLPKPPL